MWHAIIFYFKQTIYSFLVNNSTLLQITVFHSGWLCFISKSRVMKINNNFREYMNDGNVIYVNRIQIYIMFSLFNSSKNYHSHFRILLNWIVSNIFSMSCHTVLLWHIPPSELSPLKYLCFEKGPLQPINSHLEKLLVYMLKHW